MQVLIAFIVVLAIYLLVKYSENKKYKDIEKIPGPPTVWLLGNSLIFGKSTAEAFQNQLNLVKEYGTLVRLWLGSRLNIIVSDPDKLEYILTSNEHISKSAGYEGYKLWLGNGLINSTGDYWRRHRKIITPTFHFQILEQFAEFINSNSKILIDKLNNEVGKKSVDILPFITYFNLDVITESAMRTKVDAQNNPKSDYVEAVGGYLKIYISRYFSFYKQYDFLFKFTSDYRLQQKYTSILKSFTREVIKSRKEERRNHLETSKECNADDIGIKKKTAFLDLLLDLDCVLSDEEIREEVDTFMFAGHDTVTASTCFCLLELVNHPEIQRKLVEESNDVLGDDPAADVKLNDLRELKYLDLVVKESLRFRATVPFIERELSSDITLDGCLIPKGTTIQILIYALHRMEKYWPDPNKFDPDRFLPENSETRHPFAYLPFSAGPRNCIGQKFAMLSTKAAVIKILRNFEVLPTVPKFEPLLSNKAVLESENGICVQLALRK